MSSDRVIERLLCRGPDSQGVVHLGYGEIVHTRLAIVDLSQASSQPLVDGSGRYVAVFNGEVYNYTTLRTELQALGYNFASTGDAEVVMNAFLEWECDAFRRLDGMFAIAIWDKDQMKLTLARDRFGEKPLFVWNDGGSRFAFASDLSALVSFSAFPSQLDIGGLTKYLMCGYQPDGRSLIAGALSLQPGTVQTVRFDGSRCVTTVENFVGRLSREWNAGISSLRADTDPLNELIRQSVCERLNSDVPVGLFLSGGLDSSLIASALFDLGVSLPAFCATFEEREFSEASKALQVAKLFRHPLHLVTVSQPTDDEITQIFRDVGEPLADASIIPFWFVARYAARSVRVCLGGDGADELFGGYPTYLASQFHRYFNGTHMHRPSSSDALMRLIPKRSVRGVSVNYRVERLLGGLQIQQPLAHLLWRQIFSPREIERLIPGAPMNEVMSDLTAHIQLRAERRTFHKGEDYMEIDRLSWLPNDVLLKGDRMSMAHSLELRSPFLSPALVAYARHLPGRKHVSAFKTKRELRLLAAAKLPRSIARQKKMGFRAPVATWLKGDLGKWGKSITLDGPIVDVLDVSEMERIWTLHDRNMGDHSYKLFALMSLASWMHDKNPSLK